MVRKGNVAARPGLSLVAAMAMAMALAMTVAAGATPPSAAGGGRGKAGSAARVPQAREFEFTYRAVIGPLPARANEARVWIPVASSNAHQTVALESVASPVAGRLTRNARGDRMWYADWRAGPARSFVVVFRYRVLRREYGVFLRGVRGKNLAADPPPASGAIAARAEAGADEAAPAAADSLAFYLRADRLVPTGGRMRALAQRVTRGDVGPEAKARAIYLYIFHTLRYDKSGTGWGRGDSLWACDHKRGNCTDFHSLFLSLARAEGIPARFVIGFPLPENESAGAIPGYHCWAEFYLRGAGWTPVDISEAWLDPARLNYYFGTVDPDRVRFSAGRDLQLSPPQAGPPVNYFIYPYVEVEGRPAAIAQQTLSFRDLR